jgi:hypothetical protein
MIESGSKNTTKTTKRRGPRNGKIITDKTKTIIVRNTCARYVGVSTQSATRISISKRKGTKLRYTHS